MTSTKIARTPMPPPISNVVFGPFFFFFFFSPAWSSLCGSGLFLVLGAPLVLSPLFEAPTVFLAVAVVLPPAALDAAVVPASADSSGASATKRYLHFGQSIFLPDRLGSRIVTVASQLGHLTLKALLAAAIRSSP